MGTIKGSFLGWLPTNVILVCLCVILGFNVQAQKVDQGSAVEQLVQSQFNTTTTLKNIMSSITYKPEDKEKLEHYFEHKILDLQNVIFQQLLSKKNNKFDADGYFKAGIKKLVSDYKKHGVLITDELKLAIKKGTKFKGPFSLPSPQDPPPGPNEPCTNMNFETGDHTGWEGERGQVSSAPTVPYTYTTVANGIDPVHHTIVTAGNDPNLSVPLPMVNPDGGSYSIRLGDLGTGRGAAKIRQTFNVTSANTNFSYSYAVVVQDPGTSHNLNEKPYFTIRMIDGNGNEIDCSPYQVIAGANVDGFLDDPNSTLLRYKPWSTVFIPLGGFVGQDVTIEFTSGDCSKGGHYGYAYVEASCKILDLVVKRENNDCNSPNATLTAPPGGASYLWTPNGETTQSITATASGKYTVTITSPAGPNCTATLEYEFQTNPQPPIADFDANNVCVGEETVFTDQSVSNVPGKDISSWKWDIGGLHTTIEQNPKFTFPGGGTYDVKLVVFNSNGCADSITKQVNVLPALDAQAAVTYVCTGKPTVDINLSVNATNVEYSKDNGTTWQNSNSFTNLDDGNYHFRWRAPGFCEKDTALTISNLPKKYATVEDPTQDYCLGDQVTLTSNDATCSSMRWYKDNSTTTSFQSGCDLNFTMGNSDTCFYFEPLSATAPYTGLGANALQGWGQSKVATFTAHVPLTIKGFQINGDEYWNGCTDFNTTITVMQNGTPVAGPVNLTLECDRTIPNTVTGLNLFVPAGTGYTLEVGTGNYGETTGAITNEAGVITIATSGPFYNWEVEVEPGCPVRDSVCVNLGCACPDTTLNFSTPICANETFDISTLLTNTTSPGSWIILSAPAGSNPATLTGNTFNANQDGDAGEYTLEFTVDGGPYPGCAIKNTRKITINALEDATIEPNQGPFCENEGNQNIALSNTATPGGTWSANKAGIIDATTGEFDPSAAGAGKHWLYYETPGPNCKDTDSIEIEVTPQLNTDVITPDTSLCADATSFQIRLDQNLETNGVWSGTGVNTSGVFDPATSGDGSFYIKFVVSASHSACSDSDSVLVTVNKLDTAIINQNHGPYCIKDPLVTIQLDNPSTLGGTWTSNPIGKVTTTGDFDPATAGKGTHKLFYTTPGPECPTVDSIEVIVNDAYEASILLPDTNVCAESPAFTVRLDPNASSTGIWKGTGVSNGTFDPNVSGPGTFKVKYIATGFNPACSDSDSVNITVTPFDTAVITPNQGPFCIADGIQNITLENSSTPGGTWSSQKAGIIDASSGDFNPATAGAGKHWVYYTTPGPLCPAVDSIELEVKEKLVADIVLPDTTICAESSAFTVRLNTSSSSSGVWKGTGVSNGNFDPTISGPGTFKIKYIATGFNSACSDSDSVNITVTPYDTAVITPNQGPFCIADGIQNITLENSTTLGGTWTSQKAGIIDASSGGFNPAIAGDGKHWVYYTTPGPLCPVVDSIEIEVKSKLNALIALPDTSICAGTASFNVRLDANSETNGTWSGTGVTNGVFNPLVSGVGSFTLKYVVSGFSTACSDSDTVRITVIRNADATILPPSETEVCENSDTIKLSTLETGGIWSSVPGNFISNNGEFDPTSQKAGTTKIYHTIAGMCGDIDSTEIIVNTYPDPTITPAGPICESGADITLEAVTVGTWRINGSTSNGIFSPTGLGPGLHQVINTVNGKCPSADTIDIDVKPIPQTSIVADKYNGCVTLGVNLTDSPDSIPLSSNWIIEKGGNKVFESSSANGLSYDFSEPGCYDVTITSQFQYGCASSASLPQQICVLARPVADFTTNDMPLSILDQTLVLSNKSTDAITYSWELEGADPERSKEFELTAKYAATRTDTFPVTLIASNPYCEDSITKNIIIKDIWSLYVPNAFTPNGDGINDTFFPLGKNHIPEDYTFYIFNRWGELIFKSTTLGEVWDGTHQQTREKVQIDVYVWKVEMINSYNNEKVSQVGHVSLIR